MKVFITVSISAKIITFDQEMRDIQLKITWTHVVDIAYTTPVFSPLEFKKDKIIDCEIAIAVFVYSELPSIRLNKL